MQAVQMKKMSARSAVRQMRQQGFTLIEILIVLAIITVIAIASVALIGDGFSASTVNAENQAFRGMTTKIRSIYSTAPDYNGLTTANAIDSGAIPVGRVSGIGAARIITNGWGGEFRFVANGTSTRLMTATMTNVPSADCVKVVTSLWDAYNTIGVAASESDVKTTAASAVNPNTVITACNAAAVQTINFVSNK